MTTTAAPIEVVILAPAGGLEQPWITGLQADPSVNVEACVGVLNRAVEVLGQLQPNVLVIDRPVSEAEEVIHAAYAASPQTLCFAILQEEDMASMRRLVAAGARDILVKPLQLSDLLSSMQQGMQVEESRRQRAGLPTLRSNHQQATPGKVVVVMGPKGGVGTTTIATNVAVALKLVTGKGVALADFNLQFGDVAVLLNLWSKHTLHDLALHHEEIDDALIHRVMVPH